MTLKMITQVTSRSHRMSVEFHSDRRVTGTGFLAKWRKVMMKMKMFTWMTITCLSHIKECQKKIKMFLVNKPKTDLTSGQIKGGSPFWHCILAAQESGWSGTRGSLVPRKSNWAERSKNIDSGFTKLIKPFAAGFFEVFSQRGVSWVLSWNQAALKRWRRPTIPSTTRTMWSQRRWQRVLTFTFFKSLTAMW